jgi:hypothetical protein
MELAGANAPHFTSLFVVPISSQVNISAQVQNAPSNVYGPHRNNKRIVFANVRWEQILVDTIIIWAEKFH